MTFVKRFGLFWWDFIVGDSMTLAIGSGLAIGAGALIAAGNAEAAQFLLPVIVVGTLAASLLRR